MWRKHNNERPWLVLDLGEAKTVEFLKIAFFKGHERNYNFDIQVSADNQDGPWKTVSKAISGGQTDRFEIFKTEELNGQYIRILGDGNSYKGPKDFAEWTNIYEIEVWGN